MKNDTFKGKIEAALRTELFFFLAFSHHSAKLVLSQSQSKTNINDTVKKLTHTDLSEATEKAAAT